MLEGLLLEGESIPGAERRKLRRQLLDYCKRDTLATVKLYERLLVLARTDAARGGKSPR